jgi:hypothetical protein
MSRFGKIARLPLDIREQLNRRLQDGEIGKDLVVWLNSVPEVQAVLKAEFGDRPVNEPNLSDWKTGGYQDWLVHQDTMAQVSLLVASAKALGGASPMPLTELLANCLAARYVVELGRLMANGNGGGDLEMLRKICRDVLALRRLDLAGQRLRIEREAADRLLRADEKEQAQERLAAADAAVEREDRYVDDLIWRKEHQNDPAYADCCDPLSPEEEAYVNEGAESEEEEPSAGAPEATGAALEDQPVAAQDGSGQSNKGELSKIKVAQEQPVGSSQSSPLREEGQKEGAQGAGKTGAAVAPGTTAQDGSGQSNKGELSKIKANKGKLRMPKAGAIPEAAAKAVRDATILMGTLEEGE